MNIVAIHAGLNTPSLSRMLTDEITRALQQNASSKINFQLYELRDLAMDIAQSTVTGYLNLKLSAIEKIISTADIIVAVSPVFNASMSGLFKSFFDILPMNSLEGKVVILGATGGSERHSMVIDMVMRPLFSYMRANTVPTGIYATSNDWAQSEMTQRVNQAAHEALNSGQITHLKRDVSMSTLPFEEMLTKIKQGNRIS